MRYQNPILYCDYSDPDVIRVGDEYYMTASSFCNVPGLPVLRSGDMVNWELISYALRRIPDASYDRPRHGCGVWAPAIRFHNGLFYICFPMPDEGLYMVTARDPAGEWSEPVQIWKGAGFIDPCPFWDEDGSAWLVNGVAASRIGYKSVLFISRMAEDGLSLIGEPKRIYDGTEEGNITTEGPKMYKREGRYYIFAPAGGVKTGWQLVLRSEKPEGPYESRIVMKQGSTGVNGPHQGAWVTAADGSDWFFHFQDVFAAGRIMHLQPMCWREDGWPLIGRVLDENATFGEPVLEGELPWEEVPAVDHASPWQWNANPSSEWLGEAPDGEIKLCAGKVEDGTALCDVGSLYLRKWEAPEFVYEASMDLSGMQAGSRAGMISLGIEYAAICIEKTEKGIYVCVIRGKQRFKGGYSAEESVLSKMKFSGEGPVRFRMTVRNTNGVSAVSPKPEYTLGEEASVLHPEEEVCIRAFDENGKEVAAVSYPAVAGRWVGVKYGFFHITQEEAGASAVTIRTVSE